ncbi:MAG: hypothetical protein P8J52_10580 [Gammaproteobacteria bacterium]|nr:hypothetical protein [Gammaproteobacteria bacterium]
MPLKIVIVSGFPLHKNPRTVKEAATWADEGHSVTILTACFTQVDRDRDNYLIDNRWQVVNVLDLLSAGFWEKFFIKGRRRFLIGLFQLFGYQSIGQLGYTSFQLKRWCKLHEADLYSLHLESSLAVMKVIVDRKRKFVVDFEDWYSKDLLPQDQNKRPVKLLESLERYALEHCSFATAASKSMGNAISEFYNVPPPLAIYNCFSLEPIMASDKLKEGTLRIVWFSQTIGPGRGLEQLALVLSEFDSELHLIGEISDEFEKKMKSIASSIFVHSPVLHQDLITTLATFDIGFAGELSEPENRNVTITNKVFQYLLAGLPMIVSRTDGQLELLKDIPEVATFYDDLESLKKCIAHWMDQDFLERGHKAALEIASNTFNWRVESRKLVNLLDYNF